MSTSGGVGVRTIWKVPTKSVEPKLGAAAEERVRESVARSHSSTMIAAAKPINQVEPDHWHTKADKSTVTAADLEAFCKKYKVPTEIELLLPILT